MVWVASAITGIGGALIGNVAGALIGANGQQQAASTQADAQGRASQTQMDMFNKLQANQKPYMDAGGQALNAAMYGMGMGGSAGDSGVTQGQFTKGFSPTDFTNNLDPGYGFQLQQGGQAVRNADTPAQGALSGSALKDLMGFNQSMASTGYQNAFNRYNTTQNNIFGRLSGIAGLGQNAAANVGNNGTTLGTGVAQSQAAQGASLAGGQLGAANAVAGAAPSLGYLMSGYGGGTPSVGSGSNSNAYGGSMNNPSANIGGGS